MPTKQLPFLATTAIEDFWDTSSPIIFLGEWCKLFGSRAEWKKMAAPVLPCPWSERGELERAFRYVEQTHEWLLPILADRLNAIHGTRFGDRYWRIVAGPWLLYFILTTYDRYRRIASAIEAFSEFTTIGLAAKSFKVPVDAFDFIEETKSDRYNLQLYTRILEGLGFNFPCKSIKPVPVTESVAPVKKGSLARIVAIALLRKLILPFAPIVLRSAYFPTIKEEILLTAKTLGKIAFSYATITDLSELKPDPSMRGGLTGLTEPSEADPYRRLVAGMIASEIPISLIEGFAKVGKTAKQEYPRGPKIIFSAIGWHFDEAFKQWAADSMVRGAKLMGVQHGGNYGCFHEMPYHELEYKAVDRFYSWGWIAKEWGSKIKPFPAAKLCGRVPMRADNSRKGILYVTTDTPRYSITFQYSEFHHLSYIDWQMRFLKAVVPSIGSLMRVRPHAEDSGWGYVERWHEVFPELAIETWATPFVESLANCRLYVSDHLETTFIEALAADKPSILFYNPEHRRLREEAVPFYGMLREAGILHDTPESAVAAIEVAYPDVEAWWNLPSRQAARKAFCERFALSGPDTLDRWAEEFKSLAKNPSLI